MSGLLNGVLLPDAMVQELATKLWDAVKSVAVGSTDRVPAIPGVTLDNECAELYLWLRWASLAFMCIEVEPPSHVPLSQFTLHRYIMQNYRQDQVNRRAAIKLMFTTSLTGVMTSDLDYDPGRPRNRQQDEEKNAILNLPQVHLTLKERTQGASSPPLPPLTTCCPFGRLWPSCGHSGLRCLRRRACPSTGMSTRRGRAGSISTTSSRYDG